ncbi:MAG: FAD-binding oxidoreductase [Sphingomonadales bacterium]|nr:FAD-binding oxidoreductase [Sphingomonadales bacterium]
MDNGYAAIPYGGGSGVTDGFTAPEYRDAWVIIDLGKMNQVLEVDPASAAHLSRQVRLGLRLKIS